MSVAKVPKWSYLLLLADGIKRVQFEVRRKKRRGAQKRNPRKVMEGIILSFSSSS